MGNEMRTVKVSAEVFARLTAWQKKLSEQAAKSVSGVSPRMVVPTLGSVVEVAVDALDAVTGTTGPNAGKTRVDTATRADAAASFERFNDHFGRDGFYEELYEEYEVDLDVIRRALRGR